MCCEKAPRDSGVVNLIVLPRFIPQRQFDPVPQAELVVDQSQIILHHMLGGPERIGDLPVLAALGYALDDEVFAFAWPATVCCLSNHNCLLKSKVASLTRLIPPLIPKRRNRRLKCALTVRSAMFRSLAISELSHPWRSRSMT